jgi:hypothetical protein
MVMVYKSPKKKSIIMLWLLNKLSTLYALSSSMNLKICKGDNNIKYFVIYILKVSFEYCKIYDRYYMETY